MSAEQFGEPIEEKAPLWRMVLRADLNHTLLGKTPSPLAARIRHPRSSQRRDKVATDSRSSSSVPAEWITPASSVYPQPPRNNATTAAAVRVASGTIRKVLVTLLHQR